MSNAHTEFGHFLREQRTRLRWSTAKVEEKANLGSGSLSKYEQGRRLPNSDAANGIKEALCVSPELQARFDHLLVKAQEAQLHESPLELPLDSPKASYRVIPVPYPPFSGDNHCFVDWLMRRMFELAGVRYEIAEDFRDKIDSGFFDLKERIAAVKSGQTDLLVNLASLERARALTFLLTPIRVSVNGVMLRMKSQELSAARAFLALGNLATAVPFKILAIPNEVGWVHVTRTLKVPEGDIARLTTLNTRKLAEALTRSAWRSEPHVLVCDELTALGVLKELGQDGVMVFQPSTDESVAESEKRRLLPTHPLGIGVERDNRQLYGYLEEAIRIFLSFENESVAAAYRDLYWELVKHIADCLACDESVYFGGVRRLPMNDLSEEFRETLLHQNARSYARRCLHLSRKGLETLPRDLEPWMRVLRRARQRVQVDEARDRRRVKAILMLALQTVVGLDPAQNGKVLYRRHFEEAVGNQWPKLKYILERDLDIEIPEPQRPILDNSLEAFVSRIQKLLDGSTDRASVTAVASVEAISPSSQFDDLRKQYNDAFPDRKLTRGKDTKILVATSLGEAIGFIAIRQEPRYGSASLEIVGFFVAEHMRRQGVGSRLVRKAVEYADRKELNKGSRIDSIWINALVPEEAKELFLRCGFRTDEERLVYHIDRLHEVGKPAARSALRGTVAPENRDIG